MIVSTHFVYFQHYSKEDLVAVDTSRIAASVVTGVGFRGAGAILRTGISIQGLTTAAGLWLVAAIGLSAGGGMCRINVAATAIGVALTILHRLERKRDDTLHRRVTLVIDEGTPPLATRLAGLTGKRHCDRPSGVRSPHGRTENSRHLSGPRPKDLGDVLLEHLQRVSGVRRIRIEPGPTKRRRPSRGRQPQTDCRKATAGSYTLRGRQECALTTREK